MKRLVSHPGVILGANFIAIALFTTAHQIGTAFDSASGIRFPALVESTKINLVIKMKTRRASQRTGHTQGSVRGLVVDVRSGDVD